MNRVADMLVGPGIRTQDFERRLSRILMVVVFLFFGYQSLLNFQISSINPFVLHRTMVLWMYPACGIGGSWMMGAAEWLLGLLILAGFWIRMLGIAGSLGACFLLASTLTALLFSSGAAIAGMGSTAIPWTRFLVEDALLLLAALCLLRQDWLRLTHSRIASPQCSRRRLAPRSGLGSETLR